MEQLIELLNEYEIEREEKIDLFNDKEKPLWEWYKDCTGDLTFEPIDSKILNGEAFSCDTADSVIISKSYGFIGWLVDNDKIERKKVGIYAYNYAIAKVDFNHIGYKEPQILHRYVKDEGILMLLSISDTPIEFLVSILKQDDKELQTNV